MISTPIISPQELLFRLESSPVRIVDARSGPEADRDYAASHLRGALHAHLERDLSGALEHPERGGRHPLPSPAEFAAVLCRLGIEPGTEVVVYDDQGGANAASRLWWLLRAVGHRSVAVLDGGLSAALSAGVPVDGHVEQVEPVRPYPADAWQLPTVSMEEAALRSKDPGWMLLDVREGARFRGEVEPIDSVPGHIPGAVNLYFGENLRSDGRFLSPDELAARYRKLLGPVPPERLVVHCGSGVTACHTLLALERAGMTGAALYVGSYSEWCRNHPTRTGEASPPGAASS